MIRPLLVWTRIQGRTKTYPLPKPTLAPNGATSAEGATLTERDGAT